MSVEILATILQILSSLGLFTIRRWPLSALPSPQLSTTRPNVQDAVVCI